MVFVLPRIGQEKSQQVVDSCKYAVYTLTLQRYEIENCCVVLEGDKNLSDERFF